MKVLKENDLKLFEQIASLPQDSLLKTLYTFLKKQYGEEKVTGTADYLIAKGDIPIALVAHLDTVFDEPPKDIFYDPAKGVVWSNDGLGADDRAGVFAILKIIRSGLKPHIIFTTDEEIGGKGAYQLVADFPNPPFKELKYIIQLDRQGISDCVFYDCANDDFVDYVEEFGFVEAFGSFSDISILCSYWGIAGVNLSIGYKNEHSYREMLYTAPLLATIDKVSKMLKDAKNAEEFKYIHSIFASRYSYLWKDYINSDEIINCDHCGKASFEYDMIPVKTVSGGTVFYCPDCMASDKIGWCADCFEAFEIDETGIKQICRDCRKANYGGHKCTTSKK